MPPKKSTKSDNTAQGSTQSISLAPSDDDDEPNQIVLSRDMQTLVSALTASFTAIFNTSIEKIVDAIDKRLSQKLDSHDVEIFDLHKKCDRLERQVNDLSKENFELRDTMRSLSNKFDALSQNLDDLDQYSRGMNILIHGIPVLSQQPGNTEPDLEPRVVSFLNSNLGISLTEIDIGALHRLPGPSTTASSRIRPPPILVQFNNRKTRNSVLSKRKLLKGKNVSMTEQLTVKKSALLRKANLLVQDKKIISAWSHDGRIIAKLLSNETLILTNSNVDQF